MRHWHLAGLHTCEACGRSSALQWERGLFTGLDHGFRLENLLVVDPAPAQGRQQHVLFGGPETPVPSGCLGTHTHFTIPPPVTGLGNVF